MEINNLYAKRKRLMALIVFCALLLPGSFMVFLSSVENFGVEHGDSIQAIKIASQVPYQELTPESDVRFLKGDMMLFGEYAVNREENVINGYSRETEHYYVAVFMDGDKKSCYASLLIDEDNPHFSQVSNVEATDLTALDLSGYYQCRTVSSHDSELAGLYAEAMETLYEQVGEIAADTGLIFTYIAGTEAEYSEILDQSKSYGISAAIGGFIFSISCIMGIVYGIKTRKKIAAQIQEQYAWQARFLLQQNDNPQL